jgi:uncharacterized protein (DUF1800 family)
VTFSASAAVPSESETFNSGKSIYGSSLPLPATATALTTGLFGCGGGNDASNAENSVPALPPPLKPPTRTQASRFLAQASMGANPDLIESVVTLGFEGWLNQQMLQPTTDKRWNLLLNDGFSAITFKNAKAGFDEVAWNKLLSSPDTLRQRMVLALSEIFVAAIDGMSAGHWQQFAASAYLDILEAHAFGNYRTLLQAITLSPAMGGFLTYRGSAKANPVTGALPDENYARELMQLFTIGLVELNGDGTPKLVDGTPIESYQQEDVTGLARVFTGWEFDYAGVAAAPATNTPDYVRRPLTQVAARYESGTKTFLGTTIPAGTPAMQCLDLALDALFGHANVAPFFCRQLIQRLVTSNPSPAYVHRIAAVFENDGAGVRGNLAAVVRALLLDTEARSDTAAADTRAGKLREPILRFTAWARAYGVTSPNGAWAVGDTSDPARALGQSPLRAPSVFNFFQAGYTPANTAIADASLVAPEFQITSETSVIGYLNFMQRAVAGSLGDLTPDYTPLMALADDAQALLDEIDLVLAANQLSPESVAAIVGALQTMPAGSDAHRRNRIQAALLLVMAAPEFIVQK